jgi:3-oxoacyl-[acyl-carrier-protein] synthase III
MSNQFPLTDIGIVDATYHLPGEAVDVKEWGKENRATDELINLLIENDCRYFYEGSEVSDADAISSAIDKLAVSEEGWHKKINYLVHAHTQNFSMPAPPSSILSELAAKYQMDIRMSFSVTHLACASVINGIDLAAKLLLQDPSAEYALIVTSDRTFGGSKYRLRPPGCIQSDGSSAILLSRKNIRCHLGATTVRNFGLLHEGPGNPETVAATARLTCSHSIQLLKDHSEQTGIALEDYAEIIPVNADEHYWIKIAKGLRLDPSRFYFDNISKFGHANCADFAINLVERGFSLLDQGKTVICCGQSNVGAHTALTLLPNQPEKENG